jgi:ATP-dependent DNA helicase RecG
MKAGADMLSDAELANLLLDIESDRVERTVSQTNTDKFCEAVCAFSNDLPNSRQPGYLIVGAHDDGSPVGLKVSERLIQTLAAIRSDGNIQPLPSIVVQKFCLEGGELAVVEVMPSDLPPVRYKGRVYIRVGSRRAVAGEQEERQLSEKRVSFARSFDASPCMEARREDLAPGTFELYRSQAVAQDVIDANHRSIEEQLASLRLFNLQTGTPTYAGILLVGNNPRYFLSGAYIQFLLLPGTELSDLPDDQSEISGDMLTVLRELDTRIRTTNRRHLESVSPLRERTVADYPEGAVRELLMNAVVHRSYQSNTPIRLYWFSDRIEIHSPGGLYGEATPENFPSASSYRNPIIAEAMKSLGYVNRYGYGIQRAQKLLSENGNPPAAFSFESQVVLAVIRRNIN